MDFQNEMKQSLPRHQFHYLNRALVNELHEIVNNQNKNISNERGMYTFLRFNI